MIISIEINILLLLLFFMLIDHYSFSAKHCISLTCKMVPEEEYLLNQGKINDERNAFYMIRKFLSDLYIRYSYF